MLYFFSKSILDELKVEDYKKTSSKSNQNFLTKSKDISNATKRENLNQCGKKKKNSCREGMAVVEVTEDQGGN